jgi:hypothetical protein
MESQPGVAARPQIRNGAEKAAAAAATTADGGDVGLGMEPDGDGGWRIAAVNPAGPAAAVGLAAGDAITAVDFRPLWVPPAARPPAIRVGPVSG